MKILEQMLEIEFDARKIVEDLSKPMRIVNQLPGHIRRNVKHNFEAFFLRLDGNNIA